MDINLLCARIDDLKQISQKANSPKFMGFLTAQEAAVAQGRFNISEKYRLFGGYDGAERVMIGALPDWCDNPVFPIKAITITYRKCDTLSHRDFLGALMALGITRETVGDILVEKGRAVIFVCDNISKFVLTQINKIGNVGVTLTEGCFEPLPQISQKQSFSTTIASLRIDCVVAAICNMSRGQACQKIADGYVSVNSVCVTKTTVNIKQNDKITVRQRGKFDIASCEGHSKSGRIILKYNKYV